MWYDGGYSNLRLMAIVTLQLYNIYIYNIILEPLNIYGYEPGETNKHHTFFLKRARW